MRDNGIGISAEMLSRVFDLFTQVDRSLDRSQGGLGIGLTLVRQLVEMHGGSVAGLQRGRQPRQRVRHPPARPGRRRRSRSRQPESVAAGPRAVVRAAHPHRRGLSVGRREPDEDAGSWAATRSGSHCDGPSALEELTTFRPEIILLDIGLPGHGRLRGGPVASAKRPGTESIVLIALTGYGQEEDRQRSREAGFDHHLTKPVDRASLLKVIAWASGRAAKGDARSAHLSRA